MDYNKWIENNVKGTTYGQCHYFSKKMSDEFPELRLVRGLYHCPIWGQRTHWWLVTKDGAVVDPTSNQFPSGGIGEYEEVSDEEIELKVPCGVCVNCGNPIYKSNFNSSTGCCSNECAKDYINYVNRGFKD